MRIFRPHPVRLARALVAASIVVVAAGCAGGGSSSTLPNPGSNAICDPNAASISIARPSPGFGTNGNSIEIVSSTDQDQLHGSPNQFDLNLRDSFGNVLVTGPLSLVNDNGGYHPYTNDFYYVGTLQTALQGGVSYSVFLNAPNTNCTPGFIGSFST
ncbi:MAG: hypothetical protein M3154_11220 [Candidatus Eremiobacteraeota bacterium]|nr:hypothetical protein [Candidatus Eremiobacteraeota bacterium]